MGAPAPNAALPGSLLVPLSQATGARPLSMAISLPERAPISARPASMPEAAMGPMPGIESRILKRRASIVSRAMIA